MSESETCTVNNLPALSEVDLAISKAWARDALWAAIADLFQKYHEEAGLSYAALGRRIRRPRGQVQRWLSAPINMTLESAGLLAEGLDADLRVLLEPRDHRERGRNHVCAAESAKSYVAMTSVETSAANTANRAVSRCNAQSQASRNVTPLSSRANFVIIQKNV